MIAGETRSALSHSGTLTFCIALMAITAAAGLAFTGSVLAQEAVVAEKDAGAGEFVELFNGRDLAGWRLMDGGRFSVVDGVIRQDRGGGWLRSDPTFDDFELRLSFRFLSPGSNSGIFFRASDHPSPNKAYQTQTRDDSSIGSVYARNLDKPNERKDLKAVEKALKPGDEWQDYAILVKGPTAEIRLNGELINKVDKLSTEPGHIGLQGEGGRLEFRNIQLRRLKSEP